MRRHGAIDFVAMLSLPLRLFREHPEALRTLQLAYQCVLADEAQDLDPTQWALLELLAAEHRNLVVVGDPVQTLFTFRGADVRGLLDFRQRHPTGRAMTLDHSHRATQHLVQLANALSDLLAYRSGLVTDNPVGPAARLLQADDEHGEAEFVAQQIGSLIDRGLLEHPGDAAVLYRTGAQVDVLATALRSAGVPYTMHGHADLFRHRVVRDILAYLRLACNPGDRLALARALEAPPRGLGRLAGVLVDEPATTLVELPSLADAFGPAIKAGAAALVATVYALHADVARGGSPVVLLDHALDQTGYRAWLERHPDGPARLRTVARLRAIAQRAEVGLGEWLDALAGGEDVDPVESDQEATRLSSIHTAKGREWRVVFLPGLEESVLPHYRALHGRDGGPDDAALEEELRVLYVAFTRPRERLYLSYCRERSSGGHMETRHPSRWLYALPPDLLAPAA
jgi:DNA helicase-2/ATP-dependent DNA helicase PcrA